MIESTNDIATIIPHSKLGRPGHATGQVLKINSNKRMLLSTFEMVCLTLVIYILIMFLDT